MNDEIHCYLNGVRYGLQFKEPKFNWRNFFDWLLIIICGLVIVFIILGFFCTVRAEEVDWDKLVPIVIQIESGGNPYAISKDGCLGLMQISPIVLKEYNENQWVTLSYYPDGHWAERRRNGDDYKWADLYNPEINIIIGTWYLKRIWFHYLPHYKIPQTIENLLWVYNAGIGNLVKGIMPKETKNYIKKYKELAKGK